MRQAIIAVICLMFAPAVTAQTGDESSFRFDRLMEQARSEAWHEWSVGQIIREAGLFFHGSPYAVGLLDKSKEERLVTDMMQFDCVLYVETAVALARGIAIQDYSFSGFEERLESMRYRQGHRDGYCSRLHYFSEWIKDNHERGIVREITREIGGQKLDKTLDFMSTHRDSYPRLVASDSLYGGILDMESALAGIQLFHIPQDHLLSAYAHLQDGDILAISTDIKGLDVSHTGLAFAQPNGQFGLLHASPNGGVIISEDLAAYVKSNRSQIGIMVARPLDPRESPD